jgi:NTE family protein
MTKTVGLALGGGGAKGLAHVAVLEAFDRIGVVPSVISGTSIGAIIGAMYAAGMKGKELAEGIDSLLEMPGSIEEALNAKRLFGWLELLSFDINRSHFFEAEALMSELSEMMKVSDFDELKIPLKIVAADFWNREEVVFESGPIIPALSASFCLPGIFKPVELDGRILVDGGAVNPVPFDLIRDEVDIVVAVDVLGRRVPGEEKIPSYSEALFNTFQIAEKTIANQKAKTHPPDIYLEPEIDNVKVFEFHKSGQIYEESKPAIDQMLRQLEELMKS